MLRAVTAITLLFFCSLGGGQVQAQTATAPSNADKSKVDSRDKAESIYLRIVRNKRDEPVAMQTSIVSFSPSKQASGKPSPYDGVVVDLIGAVHVADKAYFRHLNQQFKKYDALLYELVAPEENNIPEGGNSQHPVGQMQQGMKSMLNLSYQLEEIDYTRRNFVHADMSPEEFSRVMGERNETWLSMMLKMMGSALALQSAEGRGNDADIMFALLFAKDRPKRLKRVMSQQFGNLEGTMSVLEGENGSTIIGERNNKALEVLRREIAKGKKRIGIFYGAGHLPDMETKLAEEFGMKPVPKSVRWLTAWDMK